MSSDPKPSSFVRRYDYGLPVSKLLMLGERRLRGKKPHNYRAMGIGESHVADLARMSQDSAFDFTRCGQGPELWAPIHAMRAMIQIGTEATIEPLARLLEYDAAADYDDINDWPMEEIPAAFGRIGAAAIPRCSQLLGDASKHTHSRLAAAMSLEKIAAGHPGTRPECVRLVSDQLQRFADNEPEWNGWLVSGLVEMKAVEAADIIERAFTADMVDETIIGDWDEVKAALGLRPPLTDEEYAAKGKDRRAAHGWLSPEEELSDADEWDDADATSQLAPDDE